MKKQHNCKFFLLQIPMILIFCLTVQVFSVFSADLVIIVPFKSEGTSVQQDEDWVRVAEQFKAYKEATGLSTRVFTLDFINSAYEREGVDEPERIKRLLYNQAGNAGTSYVMIVGDVGIFPIRYQYFGYSSDGLTHWAWDKNSETWYAHDSYGFFPCDAYYSNLWDDDDTARSFDDWDDDGDGFYGEKYYNNFRGTDGNSIHPDLALGRIPCKNPDEFYRYMIKVMAYENSVPLNENKALFIGGGFSHSQTTKLQIGAFMDSEYDIAYLLGEHGEEWDFTDEGETVRNVNALNTIIDYVNGNYPQFINYAGHGQPESLWEPGFYQSDVSFLSNFWQPAIVVAPGSCSTARYAQCDAHSTPRTVPVTITPDNNSMAEAFLTDYTDGGVIFIGSIVSNQPPGLYFDKRFFRAVEAGQSTVGACYRRAIEDFIDEYNLDTANCSNWETRNNWPDRDVGGRWYWFPPARFHSVYKVQIFGDPSVRINGVTETMTPPVTTAFYTRWVNYRNLSDYSNDYFYVDVHLSVRDEGIPVQITRYNYRVDGITSQWREGCDFSVPVYITAALEGDEGYEILYYSTNALGQSETLNRKPVSFDFTAPVSEISATYGDHDPLVVDGMLVFDADSLSIDATDNLSGVARIDYRFSSGSSYRSVYGHSATIDFPCFSQSDYEFSYRAVDAAGNEETWHTVNLRVPSCSNFIELRERFADILSAGAGRHMFNFPPEYVDNTVNLGFRAPDNNDPSKVVFQYSGPFQSDYQAHAWQKIGEASYNVKTDQWEEDWDTPVSGIVNAFYWVRAMPEFPSKAANSKAEGDYSTPRLIWINNMRNQNPNSDLLTVSGSTSDVAPGDTIKITVMFHYEGQNEALDATVRLLLDEDIYQDINEESVVRSMSNLKMDEPVSFDLKLKNENLPVLDRLAFKAAMQARDIPLLTSDYLFMNLLKRPVKIAGTVRNNKGNPLIAELELKGENLTRTSTTDKDGSYLFNDVPAGAYQISLVSVPGGCRSVLPKEGKVTIRAKGDDMGQNFILSGADDHQAPAFTRLSSFNDVAESGVITGTVCDKNFGSGVARITVSVQNQVSGLFLSPNGTWESTESPIITDNLEQCKILLNASGTQADSLQSNLPYDTRCLNFSLTLPVEAELAKGLKTITVRALDQTGNSAAHELRNTILTAGFTADKTSGTAPLTVSFSDQSTGSVLFYHWDFGDGASSELASPSHTFDSPGSYDVSLVVGGTDSSDSQTQTACITVSEKSDAIDDEEDSGDGGGSCMISSVFKE